MARAIKRAVTKCEKCDAIIHPQVHFKNNGLCLWCKREKRKELEAQKALTKES